MTTKKRIAVVYDTSYLLAGAPSILEVVFSCRFSSQGKPGGAANLRSLLSGKWSQVGALETVYHDAKDMFVIVQLIPDEVLKEVDRRHGGDEAKLKLAASLLKEGAVRFSLALDTVVGQLPGLQAKQETGPESFEEIESDTDEKLVGYAARLVGSRTQDRYDLAILASEDEELLAELTHCGMAVLGLKSADLTQTHLLHDKLTEIANLGRDTKLTLIS
jgi:hypothetical protein